MKNKYLILSAIAIIIFIIFFNFNVVYYAKNSSSAGDRILDIKYTVRWGQIHSCTGTYLYPASAAQRSPSGWEDNIEPCDVEKLKNGDYNAPVELIKYFNIFKIYKEEKDGRMMYRSRITLF